MHRIALLLFFAALGGGCSQSPVERDIAELRSDVKSALERLNKLDSTSIHNSFSRIEGHFNTLATMPFDSSLKEVYTHDLTWMDRYHRGISKWSTQRDQTRERLEKCLAQLEDLAHDSRHALLDSANVREHFEREKRLVMEALETVHSRGGEMEYYAAGVDSMVVRLDSILKDYK